MICTGSVLAMFQLPIIFGSIFLAVYVAEQYNPALGFIVGMFSAMVGLYIFDRWWSGEWPFIRKDGGKEE